MEEFVAKTFVTRRQLETAVGLINFACSVDPIGSVYLKWIKTHEGSAISIVPSIEDQPLEMVEVGGSVLESPLNIPLAPMEIYRCFKVGLGIPHIKRVAETRSLV